MDQNELYHAQALVAFAAVWNQGGQVVTTSYVLAELTALLARLRIPKPRQVQFFDDLGADPSIQVVHVDETLENESWRLWKSRPDKTWSLVDCASFAVMQQCGLREALTTDQHFEQAGFVRLLK